MGKTIVLFDMDGTLTEPRKKFTSTELKAHCMISLKEVLR